MNKNLNRIIFGILLLSIWIILSIGVGLIPLINSTLFSIETYTKINTVLINVAYSFLAGYIMYALTVIIPYNNKKKLNLLVINHYIQNYYISFKGVYNVYLSKIDKPFLNDVDLKEIEALRDSIIKTNGKNGEFIYKTYFLNNSILLKEHLIHLADETKAFINFIIPYSDFLSEKQLFLFNNIRTDEILSYIDFYVSFNKNPLSEDEALHKLLTKHNNLVEKLNLTLGDYNKIKPSKI